LCRLSRFERRGAPQSIAGFVRPKSFPHFNKCDESTPEYTRDYKAVIRDGGPARGFSQIMPSFGGVLISGEMDELVAYLRSFCEEKQWPVGELNVPRALMTEKGISGERDRSDHLLQHPRPTGHQQ